MAAATPRPLPVGEPVDQVPKGSGIIPGDRAEVRLPTFDDAQPLTAFDLTERPRTPPELSFEDSRALLTRLTGLQPWLLEAFPDELPPLPLSRPSSPTRSPEVISPVASLAKRRMSSTAVPLRFRKPSGPPAVHRDLHAEPKSVTSPLSEPSPSRSRHSRSHSTEFKSSREFRPLYLVERNRKPDEIDEVLPPLPPSTASSVVSGAESDGEYESALESPHQRAGLLSNHPYFDSLGTIPDLGPPARGPELQHPELVAREIEEVQESGQATPKASDYFPGELSEKVHSGGPNYESLAAALEEAKAEKQDESTDDAFMSTMTSPEFATPLEKSAPLDDRMMRDISTTRGGPSSSTSSRLQDAALGPAVAGLAAAAIKDHFSSLRGSKSNDVAEKIQTVAQGKQPESRSSREAADEPDIKGKGKQKEGKYAKRGSIADSTVSTLVDSGNSQYTPSFIDNEDDWNKDPSESVVTDNATLVGEPSASTFDAKERFRQKILDSTAPQQDQDPEIRRATFDKPQVTTLKEIESFEKPNLQQDLPSEIAPDTPKTPLANREQVAADIAVPEPVAEEDTAAITPKAKKTKKEKKEKKSKKGKRGSQQVVEPESEQSSLPGTLVQEEEKSLTSSQLPRDVIEREILQPAFENVDTPEKSESPDVPTQPKVEEKEPSSLLEATVQTENIVAPPESQHNTIQRETVQSTFEDVDPKEKSITSETATPAPVDNEPNPEVPLKPLGRPAQPQVQERPSTAETTETPKAFVEESRRASTIEGHSSASNSGWGSSLWGKIGWGGNKKKAPASLTSSSPPSSPKPQSSVLAALAAAREEKRRKSSGPLSPTAPVGEKKAVEIAPEVDVEDAQGKTEEVKDVLPPIAASSAADEKTSSALPSAPSAAAPTMEKPEPVVSEKTETIAKEEPAPAVFVPPQSSFFTDGGKPAFSFPITVARATEERTTPGQDSTLREQKVEIKEDVPTSAIEEKTQEAPVFVAPQNAFFTDDGKPSFSLPPSPAKPNERSVLTEPAAEAPSEEPVSRESLPAESEKKAKKTKKSKKAKKAEQEAKEAETSSVVEAPTSTTERSLEIPVSESAPEPSVDVVPTVDEPKPTTEALTSELPSSLPVEEATVKDQDAVVSEPATSSSVPEVPVKTKKEKKSGVSTPVLLEAEPSSTAISSESAEAPHDAQLPTAEVQLPGPSEIDAASIPLPAQEVDEDLALPLETQTNRVVPEVTEVDPVSIPLPEQQADEELVEPPQTQTSEVTLSAQEKQPETAATEAIVETEPVATPKVKKSKKSKRKSGLTTPQLETDVVPESVIPAVEPFAPIAEPAASTETSQSRDIGERVPASQADVVEPFHLDKSLDAAIIPLPEDKADDEPYEPLEEREASAGDVVPVGKITDKVMELPVPKESTVDNKDIVSDHVEPVQQEFRAVPVSTVDDVEVRSSKKDKKKSKKVKDLVEEPSTPISGVPIDTSKTKRDVPSAEPKAEQFVPEQPIDNTASVRDAPSQDVQPLPVQTEAPATTELISEPSTPSKKSKKKKKSKKSKAEEDVPATPTVEATRELESVAEPAPTTDISTPVPEQLAHVEPASEVISEPVVSDTQEPSATTPAPAETVIEGPVFGPVGPNEELTQPATPLEEEPATPSKKSKKKSAQKDKSVDFGSSFTEEASNAKAKPQTSVEITRDEPVADVQPVAETLAQDVVEHPETPSKESKKKAQKEALPAEIEAVTPAAELVALPETDDKDLDEPTSEEKVEPGKEESSVPAAELVALPETDDKDLEESIEKEQIGIAKEPVIPAAELVVLPDVNDKDLEEPELPKQEDTTKVEPTIAPAELVALPESDDEDLEEAAPSSQVDAARDLPLFREVDVSAPDTQVESSQDVFAPAVPDTPVVEAEPAEPTPKKSKKKKGKKGKSMDITTESGIPVTEELMPQFDNAFGPAQDKEAKNVQDIEAEQPSLPAGSGLFNEVPYDSVAVPIAREIPTSNETDEKATLESAKERTAPQEEPSTEAGPQPESIPSETQLEADAPVAIPLPDSPKLEASVDVDDIPTTPKKGKKKRKDKKSESISSAQPPVTEPATTASGIVDAPQLSVTSTEEPIVQEVVSEPATFEAIDKSTKDVVPEQISPVAIEAERQPQEATELVEAGPVSRDLVTEQGTEEAAAPISKKDKKKAKKAKKAELESKEVETQDPVTGITASESAPIDTASRDLAPQAETEAAVVVQPETESHDAEQKKPETATNVPQETEESQDRSSAPAELDVATNIGLPASVPGTPAVEKTSFSGLEASAPAIVNEPAIEAQPVEKPLVTDEPVTKQEFTAQEPLEEPTSPMSKKEKKKAKKAKRESIAEIEPASSTPVDETTQKVADETKEVPSVASGPVTFVAAPETGKPDVTLTPSDEPSVANEPVEQTVEEDTASMSKKDKKKAKKAAKLALAAEAEPSEPSEPSVITEQPVEEIKDVSSKDVQSVPPHTQEEPAVVAPSDEQTPMALPSLPQSADEPLERDINAPVVPVTSADTGNKDKEPIAVKEVDAAVEQEQPTSSISHPENASEPPTQIDSGIATPSTQAKDDEETEPVEWANLSKTAKKKLKKAKRASIAESELVQPEANVDHASKEPSSAEQSTTLPVVDESAVEAKSAQEQLQPPITVDEPTSGPSSAEEKTTTDPIPGETVNDAKPPDREPDGPPPSSNKDKKAKKQAKNSESFLADETTEAANSDTQSSLSIPTLSETQLPFSGIPPSYSQTFANELVDSGVKKDDVQEARGELEKSGDVVEGAVREEREEENDVAIEIAKQEPEVLKEEVMEKSVEDVKEVEKESLHREQGAASVAPQEPATGDIEPAVMEKKIEDERQELVEQPASEVPSMSTAPEPPVTEPTSTTEVEPAASTEASVLPSVSQDEPTVVSIDDLPALPATPQPEEETKEALEETVALPVAQPIDTVAEVRDEAPSSSEEKDQDKKSERDSHVDEVVPETRVLESEQQPLLVAEDVKPMEDVARTKSDVVIQPSEPEVPADAVKQPETVAPEVTDRSIDIAAPSDPALSEAQPSSEPVVEEPSSPKKSKKNKKAKQQSQSEIPVEAILEVQVPVPQSQEPIDQPQSSRDIAQEILPEQAQKVEDVLPVISTPAEPSSDVQRTLVEHEQPSATPDETVRPSTPIAEDFVHTESREVVSEQPEEPVTPTLSKKDKKKAKKQADAATPPEVIPDVQQKTGDQVQIPAIEDIVEVPKTKQSEPTPETTTESTQVISETPLPEERVINAPTEATGDQPIPTLVSEATPENATEAEPLTIPVAEPEIPLDAAPLSKKDKKKAKKAKAKALENSTPEVEPTKSDDELVVLEAASVPLPEEESVAEPVREEKPFVVTEPTKESDNAASSTENESVVLPDVVPEPISQQPTEVAHADNAPADLSREVPVVEEPSVNSPINDSMSGDASNIIPQQDVTVQEQRQIEPKQATLLPVEDVEPALVEPPSPSTSKKNKKKAKKSETETPVVETLPETESAIVATPTVDAVPAPITNVQDPMVATVEEQSNAREIEAPPEAVVASEEPAPALVPSPEQVPNEQTSVPAQTEEPVPTEETKEETIVETPVLDPKLSKKEEKKAQKQAAALSVEPAVESETMVEPIAMPAAESSVLPDVIEPTLTESVQRQPLPEPSPVQDPLPVPEATQNVSERTIEESSAGPVEAQPQDIDWEDATVLSPKKSKKAKKDNKKKTEPVALDVAENFVITPSELHEQIQAPKALELGPETAEPQSQPSVTLQDQASTITESDNHVMESVVEPEQPLPAVTEIPTQRELPEEPVPSNEVEFPALPESTPLEDARLRTDVGLEVLDQSTVPAASDPLEQTPLQEPASEVLPAKETTVEPIPQSTEVEPVPVPSTPETVETTSESQPPVDVPRDEREIVSESSSPKKSKKGHKRKKSKKSISSADSTPLIEAPEPVKETQETTVISQEPGEQAESQPSVEPVVPREPVAPGVVDNEVSREVAGVPMTEEFYRQVGLELPKTEEATTEIPQETQAPATTVDNVQAPAPAETISQSDRPTSPPTVPIVEQPKSVPGLGIIDIPMEDSTPDIVSQAPESFTQRDEAKKSTQEASHPTTESSPSTKAILGLRSEASSTKPTSDEKPESPSPTQSSPILSMLSKLRKDKKAKKSKRISDSTPTTPVAQFDATVETKEAVVEKPAPAPVVDETVVAKGDVVAEPVIQMPKSEAREVGQEPVVEEVRELSKPFAQQPVENLPTASETLPTVEKSVQETAVEEPPTPSKKREKKDKAKNTGAVEDVSSVLPETSSLVDPAPAPESKEPFHPVTAVEPEIVKSTPLSEIHESSVMETAPPPMTETSPLNDSQDKQLVTEQPLVTESEPTISSLLESNESKPKSEKQDKVSTPSVAEHTQQAPLSSTVENVQREATIDVEPQAPIASTETTSEDSRHEESQRQSLPDKIVERSSPFQDLPREDMSAVAPVPEPPSRTITPPVALAPVPAQVPEVAQPPTLQKKPSKKHKLAALFESGQSQGGPTVERGLRKGASGSVKNLAEQYETQARSITPILPPSPEKRPRSPVKNPFEPEKRSVSPEKRPLSPEKRHLSRVISRCQLGPGSPGRSDSKSPAREIDFAATVAAGLRESGFDPGFVINDRSFHHSNSISSNHDINPDDDVFAARERASRSRLGSLSRPSSASGSPKMRPTRPAEPEVLPPIEVAMGSAPAVSFDPLDVLNDPIFSARKSPGVLEEVDPDELAGYSSLRRNKGNKKRKPLLETPPEVASADVQEASIAPTKRGKKSRKDNEHALLPQDSVEYTAARTPAIETLPHGSLAVETSADSTVREDKHDQSLSMAKTEASNASKGQKDATREIKDDKEQTKEDTPNLPITFDQNPRSVAMGQLQEYPFPKVESEKEVVQPSMEESHKKELEKERDMDAWAPTSEKKGKECRKGKEKVELGLEETASQVQEHHKRRTHPVSFDEEQPNEKRLHKSESSEKTKFAAERTASPSHMEESNEKQVQKGKQRSTEPKTSTDARAVPSYTPAHDNQRVIDDTPTIDKGSLRAAKKLRSEPQLGRMSPTKEVIQKEPYKSIFGDPNEKKAEVSASLAMPTTKPENTSGNTPLASITETSPDDSAIRKGSRSWSDVGQTERALKSARRKESLRMLSDRLRSPSPHSSAPGGPTSIPPPEYMTGRVTPSRASSRGSSRRRTSDAVDRATALSPAHRMPRSSPSADTMKSVGQQRSASVQSQRSLNNIARLRSPDYERPSSALSSHSSQSLRRIDRQTSGDLRSASRLGEASAQDAKNAQPTLPSTDAAGTTAVIAGTPNYDPVRGEGKVRRSSMAETFVS